MKQKKKNQNTKKKGKNDQTASSLEAQTEESWEGSEAPGAEWVCPWHGSVPHGSSRAGAGQSGGSGAWRAQGDAASEGGGCQTKAGAPTQCQHRFLSRCPRFRAAALRFTRSAPHRPPERCAGSVRGSLGENSLCLPLSLPEPFSPPTSGSNGAKSMPLRTFPSRCKFGVILVNTL